VSGAYRSGDGVAGFYAAPAAGAAHLDGPVDSLRRGTCGLLVRMPKLLAKLLVSADGRR